jgi:leader peptidase (prepilin peptidase)/N-methyltransferase
MPEVLIQHPALFYLCVGLTGLLCGLLIALYTNWLPKRMELLWQHEAKEILQQGEEPLQSPLKHLWSEVVSYVKAESQGFSTRTIFIALAGLLICWFIPLHFGATVHTLALCVFALGLLTLSVIDFETFLLPDCIVFPLLWLGLITAVLSNEVMLADSVWGVVLGYLILWVPASLYMLVRGRAGMGHGDFKLLALIGAWLGWQSIPMVLVIACVVGVAGGIYTLYKKGEGLRAQFPFGPYLAIGGLVVMFTSPEQILAALF